MNIHKNPNLLIKQLEKQEGVLDVSYEYPETFWAVTVKGDFLLGDVNGFVAWHDVEGQYGEQTTATTPATIARDFGAWLRGEN